MARAGALRPSRPSSPRGCCGKLRKKCPLDKTLIKVYVIGIVAVVGHHTLVSHSQADSHVQPGNETVCDFLKCAFP